MNTAMTGRNGYMPNMGSSIDATQSESLAFFNESFPVHAFSQISHLQPDHLNSPGYPVHGKRTDLQKTCAECFHPFPTNSHLEQHASSSGHNAFSCTCGAQFSRAYTLTRHINSMIGTAFPCGLCDDRSFPRLDKLADHLRKWYRLGVKAFDHYKGGKASRDPVSPPSDRNPLVTSEEATPFYPRQIYSMAPGFGPVTMLHNFPPVSDIEPGTPSGQSSGSPGSSTAPDNWWCSQLSNDRAYPLSI